MTVSVPRHTVGGVNAGRRPAPNKGATMILLLPLTRFAITYWRRRRADRAAAPAPAAP
jgi:hypothetical protein